MDTTAQFYSQPSHVGGGFPVYSGSRRQSGGNIFGALSRMVLPLLRPLGKALGRRAIGVASNVALDALNGKSVGQSFKQRSAAAAKKGLRDLTAPVAPIANSVRYMIPGLRPKIARKSRKRAKQSGKGRPRRFVKRHKDDYLS